MAEASAGDAVDPKPASADGTDAIAPASDAAAPAQGGGADAAAETKVEPKQEPGSGEKGRRKQIVLSISQRASIVRWMVDEAGKKGEKNICSKAVRQFPGLFQGSANANIARATRLWKERGRYEALPASQLLEAGSALPGRGRKRLSVAKESIKKTPVARGRKRPEWVSELHKDLLEAFHLRRAAGNNFTHESLLELAKDLLRRSSHTRYSESMVDPASGKSLMAKINNQFLRGFCTRYRIVPRTVQGSTRLVAAYELG